MKNHLHDEEEFFSRDSKESRKEKKRVSLKDRSKFKKSDQDQLKKREKNPPKNLKRGRVLAIALGGVLVDVEDKLFRCTLKGALKKEKNRIKNLVAVGDFVHFEEKGEGEGSIAYIEKRRSVLSRAEHHMRKKEQLIAVNIDQVLITASIASPTLKPFLIDRYIIAAKRGNMSPLIIINKIDLLETASDEEKSLYDQFLKVYGKLEIPVFAVSATTGVGMQDLIHAMEGKASVLSGQSGVGKSSLINLITGSALEIGEVVAKTSKGSHTTSSTHLIPIKGGGFCIDTPGIKSFGLWDLDRSEIQAYFSEIQVVQKKCRYPNCSHLQEPGCAVKEAVKKGKISTLRFGSYSALMADLATKHRIR